MNEGAEAVGPFIRGYAEKMETVMAETTQLNATLGTTDVLWNLTDLYSGTDDPYIASDIAWCETEAAAHQQQAITAGSAELDAEAAADACQKTGKP